MAALAACGPVSPELAARQCADRARAAAGPTGEVYLGYGSGGPAYGAKVQVSSDYLTGQDPEAVYRRCFRQLTGQEPSNLPDLR